MTPAFELLDLTVRLGNRTVLDCLRGAFRGRSIGLLGPNGAGKSTLINTLLGFHTPAAGSTRVFGIDPRVHPNQVRPWLGYMPENDAFVASMSGVHFVRYMGELSGLPPRAALERAHEILSYVGLGEERYRKLGTYSVGMKQQIKLAQAIVHGPKLVFLDEPTNGLDPSARMRMLRLLRQIRDDGRTTLVISSHLLPDVEECCDEVLLLKRGRIHSHVDLEEQRRANRHVLDIRASGMTQAFTRGLIELGCDCATSDATSDGDSVVTRLRVVHGEGLDVRTIYALAQRLDVLLLRLSQRRDSLEELFLDAFRDEPLGPNAFRDEVPAQRSPAQRSPARRSLARRSLARRSLARRSLARRARFT
ncbi:MAG: ABC transporter ATP-binding protein [Polyangiaceae bacterium]